MGLNLEYVPGQGPVFDNPIRTAADVANLATAPPLSTRHIADTVRCINEGLPKEIALIGFAGAPFTLASYAIEGKGSRNYVFVKKMMYEAPELWHELMTKLTGNSPAICNCRSAPALKQFSCSIPGWAICRSTTIAPTWSHT